MKLPNTVAYAVRAACYLAQTAPELPIPCSELAREGQMPDRFLLQVLRKLVKEGILESSFGVTGGYVLSRAPDQITLRDIVDTFDNSLELQLPTLERVTPSIRTQLTKAMSCVSQAARLELHKVTIADLVAKSPSNHFSVLVRQGRAATRRVTLGTSRRTTPAGGTAVTR
jgi:Rrf2 family transcriptional regulator, cysteine metabolism repressor